MFDNSKRALSSLISIIQKMLDAFSVILFVVFTLFYGYQIFAHINAGALRIIVYCVLLIIHTGTFVFSKTSKIKGETHAERDIERREKRNKKRLFKIIKMSVNMIAILWNVVEIFTTEVTDLRIMIVIISAILLFAQIFLEIILNLLLIYFDNLRIALIEDIRGIDMDSNFVTRFVTKSLGIKKALKEVKSDDYFSDEEKRIVDKQKDKN